MATALVRMSACLVVAATALVVAAPSDVEFVSPFFTPAITDMGCGEDVDDDECETRAEVCSGIFPDPDTDATNSSEPLSLDFQACLIANQTPQLPTQPSLAPMLNLPVIPMPMPDMVPFRFCALNVTGLLKPDMTVNHTAIGDFLRTVVPPDVSADVVVSAVSACPNPLLHSLTAFMHCLRAACLILTTSDMIPTRPTPSLIISPYSGAP
ncbi:uncharacterized protein LOC123518312 isoform X2 [Portunus trituberculatus]|nr:uncharacterized protein LOC123518312 isoform X2 [Portunus trituberculatus]